MRPRSPPGAPRSAPGPCPALQFKWSEPDETGGLKIQAYVLELVPAPLGCEASPNAEASGQPCCGHGCLAAGLAEPLGGSGRAGRQPAAKPPSETCACVRVCVQGYYELYRGAERSCLVKRLQPGVRYTVRLKVGRGSLPARSACAPVLPLAPPLPPPLPRSASASAVLHRPQQAHLIGPSITSYRMRRPP